MSITLGVATSLQISQGSTNSSSVKHVQPDPAETPLCLSSYSISKTPSVLQASVLSDQSEPQISSQPSLLNDSALSHESVGVNGSTDKSRNEDGNFY